MFINPHDPKVYQQIKTNNYPTQIIQTNNSNNFLPVESNQLRLRSLLIDHVPPRYSNEMIITEKGQMFYDLTIFCPKIMNINNYWIQLNQLNSYYENMYSNLLIGSAFEVSINENPIKIGFNNELILMFGLIIIPGCNPFQLFKEYSLLNINQQNTIQKILITQDYTLIQGLPGTGKSSIISLIIRILIAKNEKIILSSYTNNAIDNILMKLKLAGMNNSFIARIGIETSIHSNVTEYYCHNKLTERINTAMLIIGTILTLSNAKYSMILSNYQSIWCIIDEATQITEPIIINILLKSQRFVLVGDTNQLKPLIISKLAQSKGMNISLFEKLSKIHYNSLITLTIQYRMNDEIMNLCNHLIYNNIMSCDNKLISNARLELSESYQMINDNDWLGVCVGNKQSVIFLNTDPLFANVINERNEESFIDEDDFNETNEKNKSNQFTCNSNEKEIEIIRLISWQLRKLKYNLNKLGIISPYRMQVKELQETLHKFHSWNETDNNDMNEINGNISEISEISTIDKFQGRDMETIILSTVRNAQDQTVSS